MSDPEIRFHPHAIVRMKERGTTEDEVTRTLLSGEVVPAKFGRSCFRHNFSFESEWWGRYYSNKQVEALAVKENEYWLVITVIVKFF